MGLCPLSYAATIRVLLDSLGLGYHLVCIWHRQDEHYLVVVSLSNARVLSIRYTRYIFTQAL